MADTELQQLVVWVGTTEKIEQARAQGLITENDFAITTDAPEFQTKLTSANAGTGISITEVGGVVKISNTQTSAEWGNILGNLPDQSDLWGYLSDILGDVSDIKSLIPTQASSSNQLADKNFVNSTVQTATANFRGNWTTWAGVPANANDYPLDYAQSRTPTVNDYLVVQDASGYTGETLEGTWRFKYSGEWSVNGKNGWYPEYQVNETPLTAAQLNALNSGATETKINQITTNQNAIGTLANLTTTEKTNLVGAVNELVSNKQDNIPDLQQIKEGAAAGASAVQPNQLGSAAYTPSTNYATAAQGTKADSAVQGVQLNGTDLTPDANSKVNVPLATASSFGVVSIGSGLNIGAQGVVRTAAAVESQIIGKSSGYQPIVPTTVDIAVREGLGNNSLTWTDAYKSSARTTIGAASSEQGAKADSAIQGVQLNGADLTPDANSKVNIQYATNTRYGVVKVDGTNFGIGLRSTGIMEIKKADDTKIEAKTNEYFPIVPANLDKAVKTGITTNTLTLTDTEQRNAQSWLGTTDMEIEFSDGSESTLSLVGKM